VVDSFEYCSLGKTRRVVKCTNTRPSCLSTGHEDTPYAYGCFFLDVYLGDYPQIPPQVRFLTTGGGSTSFHHNMDPSGAICLSLLKSDGPNCWIPSKSTLLQVLISIQGIVLVKEPYFNAGDSVSSSRNIRARGEQYNKQVRSNTVRLAIVEHLKGLNTKSFPYPEFSKVVRNHFLLMQDSIEQHVQKWFQATPAVTNEALTQLSILHSTI
jgi:ubiquitin-protein ligase